MEGVLVSAKAEGSSITTQCISGKDGIYSFPAGRLAPGKYQSEKSRRGLRPGGSRTNHHRGTQPAHMDLKLHKTKDLAAQLTSAEWLMSVPGNPDQKEMLYRCVHCHGLAPIVQSTYDEKGWERLWSDMEMGAPQHDQSSHQGRLAGHGQA